MTDPLNKHRVVVLSRENLNVDVQKFSCFSKNIEEGVCLIHHDSVTEVKEEPEFYHGGSKGFSSAFSSILTDGKKVMLQVAIK